MMSQPADLLLRHLRLASPDGVQSVDLAVTAGRWSHVGAPGSYAGAAAATYDAGGALALPGLIDVHTHFREPGGEHKGTYASESRAAAAGGVTTVLTMPNTKPFTNSRATLDRVRELARDSLIDVGFQFMADGTNLAEMEAVAGTVPAFKLYLDRTTGIDSPLADPERLGALLATGLPFVAHAEGDTLDSLLDLHRRYGTGWLHIGHVALAREVEALRAARADGQDVSGEASPHHLFLDEDDARRLGALGDMRPTLKSAADVAGLWAGLADGTLEAIATDHAPHLLAEKQGDPPPPGVPGLQTMLPLLLDAVAAGRLDLPALVRLTSAWPAQRFRLADKGAVRVGSHADLVLVDPNARVTITNEEQLTKPGWTPFAGRQVRGRVLRTLRRGAWVYADGQTVGAGGGEEVRVAP